MTAKPRLIWRAVRARHPVALRRTLALGGLMLALAGFILLRQFWFNPFPPCPFKLYLGMDCPGCGLTRAAEAFLHGDILSAFLWHPWAMAWGLFLGLCCLQLLANSLIGRRAMDVFRFETAHLWVALWTLAGFTLLRNIPWMARMFS